VKPDLMKVTESLNKEVMVVAPMQAGKYPVIVFLHGFELAFHYYEQLLHHVASHGFIAVAPQVRCCTSAPSCFSSSPKVFRQLHSRSCMYLLNKIDKRCMYIPHHNFFIE
jgi:predicted alpha/beta-fold hydrolase